MLFQPGTSLVLTCVPLHSRIGRRPVSELERVTGTADLLLTINTASSTGRASCTDNTGIRTDSTGGRLEKTILAELQSVAISSGTGKTHLLIALGTLAAEVGHRVRYTLASKLVNARRLIPPLHRHPGLRPRRTAHRPGPLHLPARPRRRRATIRHRRELTSQQRATGRTPAPRQTAARYSPRK